jgi:hypothetical protein
VGLSGFAAAPATAVALAPRTIEAVLAELRRRARLARHPVSDAEVNVPLSTKSTHRRNGAFALIEWEPNVAHEVWFRESASRVFDLEGREGKASKSPHAKRCPTRSYPTSLGE